MARGPLLSATELAAEEIRDLIESGQLAPGQRVNASLLAESLAISTTPVFDALHLLKTEGIIDVRPRRGAFVREISEQEVSDVYAIKIANEPLAAAWAADRGSDEARRKLQQTLGRLRRSVDREDVRQSSRHVDDIHNLLFEMAGSEPLLAVYRAFHVRVKLLRHLNMAQQGRLVSSLAQHTAIIDYVVGRRAEEAREAMYAHMVDAKESLHGLLTSRRELATGKADA